MKLVTINPPELASPSGYAHGVSVEGAGKLLFLGGQVGWDARGQMESGFAAQFARALDNLLATVREAGGEATSIVQLRIYVLDRHEYASARKELGRMWRERFGRHYPAIALVQVAALLEEGALVEIEGMAVIA
jgi:enamine deaminase RidA (YjgF/YER057c/UK114 family)